MNSQGNFSEPSHHQDRQAPEELNDDLQNILNNDNAGDLWTEKSGKIVDEELSENDLAAFEAEPNELDESLLDLDAIELDSGELEIADLNLLDSNVDNTQDLLPFIDGDRSESEAQRDLAMEEIDLEELLETEERSDLDNLESQIVNQTNINDELAADLMLEGELESVDSLDDLFDLEARFTEETPDLDALELDDKLKLTQIEQDSDLNDLLEESLDLEALELDRDSDLNNLLEESISSDDLELDSLLEESISSDDLELDNLLEESISSDDLELDNLLEESISSDDLELDSLLKNLLVAMI